VRNKLDSINVTDTGKSFTILIHGANVDIRSHCIYDIVFESKWSQKFVDSFSDVHNICWLQIAYTVDIFDVAEISKVIWALFLMDSDDEYGRQEKGGNEDLTATSNELGSINLPSAESVGAEKAGGVSIET
jgi:hypothetical protein